MKWSSPVVFVVGAVLLCGALAVLLSSLHVPIGGIAQVAGLVVGLWLMVWFASMRE